MRNANVSRRKILSGIGAGVGGLAVGVGTGTANNSGRHIVGTSTQAATDATRRKAGSIHRTFDFDDIGQAVAGQFSQEALDALEQNPNVRYIETGGRMDAIGQTLP